VVLFTWVKNLWKGGKVEEDSDDLVWRSAVLERGIWVKKPWGFS